MMHLLQAQICLDLDAMLLDQNVDQTRTMMHEGPRFSSSSPEDASCCCPVPELGSAFPLLGVSAKKTRRHSAYDNIEVAGRRAQSMRTTYAGQE